MACPEPELTYSGGERFVSVRRVSGSMILTMAGAVPAAWAGERAIALRADPAPLNGTLLLPEYSAEELTAVLILAGSGPVDRDGNLPGAKSDSLKQLAQGLAEHGIASLRIDKRGIAASQAAGRREDDLRFETYVTDAVHWLEALRAEPGVRRVGVIGHSEGALVATLAAQRLPDLTGLVAIAGAGVSGGTILRQQLEAAGLSLGLREIVDRILTELERGHMVADAVPQLEAAGAPPQLAASLFRPSVQPYLISWLGLDPAAELQKVRVPTLLVQGTTDLQVPEDDARRLAAARPDAELRVIEGMNHVLKIAPIERAANLATYGDPNRPVVPALIERIARFLRR